jgi:CDGSH-type Zn-finger protein
MTKGQRAGDGPIAVEVEKDKSYYWCACGISKKQPFCDGSHSGTKFKPFPYKALETKKCFFVHVNKQTVSLFVMVHTTKSNIEIKNILTTLRL